MRRERSRPNRSATRTALVGSRSPRRRAKKVSTSARASAADQADVAGQVGHASVNGEAFAVTIAAGDRHGSARGSKKAHQQAEQRRFARAIWAEQTEYLAGLNGECAVVERGDRAIGLGQCGVSTSGAGSFRNWSSL